MEPKVRIRRGIRWKLLTTMIGLIVGLLAILTWVQVSAQSEVMAKALERHVGLMKERLIEKGNTLSAALQRKAEEDLAAYNYSSLSESIKKAVKEHPELEYAILMDMDRTAYIHTRDPKFEQEVLDAAEDLHAAKQTEPTAHEFPSGDYIEFIAPIRVSIEQWGVLRLAFSLESLNEEIVNSRAENLQRIQAMVLRSIVTSLAFIALGAVVVIWISNRISRPLTSLTETANELARGDFGAAAGLQVQSRDELGVLSKSFTEMAEQLRSSYAQLEDYSRTLEAEGGGADQRARGCPQTGGGRKSLQERVLGQYEPRDPDSDERDHRHDGVGARYGTRDRAAPVPGDGAILRGCAAGDH